MEYRFERAEEGTDGPLMRFTGTKPQQDSASYIPAPVSKGPIRRRIECRGIIN